MYTCVALLCWQRRGRLRGRGPDRRIGEILSRKGRANQRRAGQPDVSVSCCDEKSYSGIVSPAPAELIRLTRGTISNKSVLCSDRPCNKNIFLSLHRRLNAPPIEPLVVCLALEPTTSGNCNPGLHKNVHRGVLRKALRMKISALRVWASLLALMVGCLCRGARSGTRPGQRDRTRHGPVQSPPHSQAPLLLLPGAVPGLLLQSSIFCLS